MTASKHEDAKHSKNKDDNNKDNPHAQNELKDLGVEDQDRNHFAQLMQDGKTVEDAKAIIAAAKVNGKVSGSAKSTGKEAEVDPVREGSNDLAYKGINATEAETETNSRKEAKAPKDEDSKPTKNKGK